MEKCIVVYEDRIYTNIEKIEWVEKAKCYNVSFPYKKNALIQKENIIIKKSVDKKY